MLKTILNRNLLKYAAGRAIFCPKCNEIADYRRWVIATSPSGANTLQCCDKCFDAITAGQEDRLATWDIVRHSVPKALKAPKNQCPQKPGKVLSTWLRKATQEQHADRQEKRKFPAIVHSSEYALTRNEDGEWSNPILTAQYVAKFCQINHLKG